MKQLNKFSRAIVAIVMMLGVSLSTLAGDFYVGGIYYNILDETAKTVEVTFSGSSYDEVAGEYTGDVTIPNSATYSGITYSVTSIGKYAFYDCTGLTSITIPNSVTSIGYSVFEGCSGLKSITIPNSVTSIGSSAFSSCSGLTEVNISDLSAWCKIDFNNYSANPLYYAHHLKLNGTEITNLVIPNDITEIKNYTFYDCTGLTSVTIPNSVTAIGSGAFSDCSGLTSVTIPSSVTSIGSWAFSGCSVLTSVIIPNSVTAIESRAFDGCFGLASVTIPNSVTSIGDWAFSYCSGLASVTIPNSVTSIGDWAFHGCDGLTEVNITDLSAWCKIDFGNTSTSNPLYYANHLKLNGTEITNLVIPNDITEIKQSAFKGCSGLTEVTIPNSVTSIGGNAFEDCTGLTSVTIGNSVTSIGSSAFKGCSGLTEVTIPNSVTSIGAWTFIDCTGLTEVTIPNSVTSIGAWALMDCTGLTTVNFNATNCTSMGSYDYPVFYGCSNLSTLNIGENVTNIPDYAFRGCSDLKKIITLNPTPPTCASEESFYSDNYTKATLYVPKDSYAIYFIDGVWGKFTNIVKIEIVSSIKLNATSIQLDKGSDYTLSATINPTDATITDIIWTSSNPQVATVDQSGKVRALSAGTTTISATTIDGSDVSASCNVTVNNVDTKISLSKTEASLPVNEIMTLSYTIVPSTTSVQWSTSDPNIAAIKVNSDNSVSVVGMAAGIATITATANDGSNISAFCVVTVTDPNASENEGETISAINITEKWLISRTNDKFSSGITKLATNYSKIRTATIYQDYAIFGWSKTMTYAVGDSTASNDFAHLLIYDLSKGTEIKEVQLTVNSEPISGTLCANQIGTDDAGNLWVAGLVFDTSKTAIKVYKVDNIDSGVCSLAAELLLPEEEASYFGRMDYCHIIGDITGKTSGAVFMSPMSSQGGATGCWVHRWILPEGGTEWEPGFDGYVCWDTSELETYPAGQTVWNGAPTVTIVKDEGFEGQNFYIDAFVTAPVLYNTEGGVVDGFMNNEEMAPAVGTNGVAEFAIGDRNFIVYSLAQYHVSPGCQVRIAELGEGMSFSGMTGLWDIPTAGLGEVSDGGLRIHSISTHKVYDANGKEGVYLLTYKSNNGVGLYLISEEGFDENPATTPITASSISLDFKSCDLDKGATTTLTATILPENVSDKTVTWSSSDENVATVDTSGKVTGISAGTTTITATTNDGSNLSAFCVVTVNATIVPNVALSSQPVELNLQDTTGSSLIIDMLNENENISAIQFDINLPAGLDIADIDGEYDITLSDRATSSHSVSSAKQADGSIRVIAYSTTSKSFKESEGALFSIKLVGNNIEEGEYLITLSNILMTSPSEVEYHQDSFEIPLVVINYILGDTNGDKLINVTDIVRVANYILGNVPSNFVFAAADVKTDGVINVSDIVGVSNLILNGSASTTSIITQSVKNTSTSSLFLDDFSIAQGETKTIELFVDNTMEFTAMQFDVQMPIGLNFVNAKLTPRATNTHNVITQEQANGNIRLISYSNNNTNYQDNEGAILTIDVKATDNFVGGDIVLKEIILVENNLTETCPTDVVATASIPTGIENVYSHTKIYAEGRNIVVESPLTQIISISTIEGITHMIEVTAGKNVIPTQNAGLYIVTTENQTNKLVIR